MDVIVEELCKKVVKESCEKVVEIRGASDRAMAIVLTCDEAVLKLICGMVLYSGRNIEEKIIVIGIAYMIYLCALQNSIHMLVGISMNFNGVHAGHGISMVQNSKMKNVGGFA